MSAALVRWLESKLEAGRMERAMFARPVCDVFEHGEKCTRPATRRIRCNGEGCGRLVGLCCDEHVDLMTGPMELVDLICGHDGPASEIHTVEAL